MDMQLFPTGYGGAFPTDVTSPMPSQIPGSTGTRSTSPTFPTPAPRPPQAPQPPPEPPKK